jgi:hypothetical protein
MEGVLMDAERFDTITRTLAWGRSRRGVLRALGGAGAGGVLALGGRGAAPAKGRRCRKGGIPCGQGKGFECCRDDKQCRDGACVDAEMEVEGTCHTTSTYDGSGGVICRCWTAGSPAQGGSYCTNPSTCGSLDDGTCAAQGASCTCS